MSSETPSAPRVALRSGAWHGPRTLELDLPAGWRAHMLPPRDAPALADARLEAALAEPLGSAPLRERARGRRRAVVAVDDLTRPTPAHRILPLVLRELAAAGLGEDAVDILIGTAAHRPMRREEIARKLGEPVVRRFRVSQHDFVGAELRFVGFVEGGPVELNRRFLDADLRVVVGGAVPHNETGFGGGAKMVVPGLAGRRTIAHFHGALPPRPAGALEPASARADRRSWAEAVARHVGVDFAVCAAVNAEGELAALSTGDVVQAHRAAAARAGELGATPVPRGLAERADAVLVNAWPLDTDPIQMAKSLTLVDKLPPRPGGRRRLLLAVNAASDGIFYHGMGMGCGLQLRRLLRNVPAALASAEAWSALARSLARAAPAPMLAARSAYFHLNHLPWSDFLEGEGRRPPPGRGGGPLSERSSPLVLSRGFPEWGFRRRHRRGRLFREWAELRDALSGRAEGGEMLVFPCAPLQLPEVV